jgi:CheY-like chemotaxis protein/glycine cleavage system H lipoate-binding protein
MDRSLTVLTVDDEQIVLDSVAKQLKKQDYILLFAQSVKEALQLLDSQQVDIILTDLMMPEIDGLEFLKIMKERSPQTPVIMITGYATINTALQATNMGAFDYVAKPFTKSELVSVVQRAAELARASEARGEHTPQPVPAASAKTPAAADTETAEYGWNRLENDGTVVLGVERRFLEAVGEIQNVFLPAKGDELRQGSVYVRIFSSDLRSFTVLSPLSGTVIDVNEECLVNPIDLTQKPECDWLVRLRPSKFEFEVKELGL